MKFKTLLTVKLLESSLSAGEINLLPASYQRLGNVCFIKLDKNLHKHKAFIGKTILELFPQFKAVCLQKRISGKFRKPEIELIAGNLPKEIFVKENDCIFKFNPKEVMYSQGNHYEKKRMIKEVKDGEIIADLFAGIGYFSIPIAKAHPKIKIYAIEINPLAFKYLEENIRLNYLSNVIPMFGDCTKVIEKLPKADRILMGLIPSCKKYIPAAMKITKRGTIIHYHGTAKENEEKNLLKDFSKYKIKLIALRKVKSFKPNINHVVLDVLVV